MKKSNKKVSEHRRKGKNKDTWICPFCEAIVKVTPAKLEVLGSAAFRHMYDDHNVRIKEIVEELNRIYCRNDSRGGDP